MIILDANIVEGLREQLQQDMPRTILLRIASQPFITINELTSQVLRQFPSMSSLEDNRRRCANIAKWFINSGDIASAGNHRFYVLPPYLVEYAKSEKGSDLILHGNPKIDDFVAAEVRPIGWKLEHTLNFRAQDSQGGRRPMELGYQRILRTNSDQIEIIRRQMDKLHIPLVTAGDLAKKLPSINHLMVPPTSAFQSSPPRWGIWKIYAPELQKFYRWNVIDSRIIRVRGILQWMPSDDWKGEQSIRYFYSDERYENLADLSPINATLWMFYLDRQANNSRSVRYREHFIRVPAPLPAPHIQWLRLASTTWELQADSQIMQFSLKESENTTLERLNDSLGLKIIAGFPVKM